MIGGKRIVRMQPQFGLKFFFRGFKIALKEINASGVVVSVGQASVEIEGSPEFCESIGKVTLLRERFAQQEMDLRIAGVLLEEPPEDCRRGGRVIGSHERSSPGVQQARIIRRVALESAQNLDGLLQVIRGKIAEAKELPDKAVLGMRRELALEWRNCVCI